MAARWPLVVLVVLVPAAVARIPDWTFTTGDGPVLPSWEPTWDMAASTVCMPCNFTGPLNITNVAQFGIVDVDWWVTVGPAWVAGRPSSALHPAPARLRWGSNHATTPPNPTYHSRM
jgi:hypothetical protein